MLLATIYHQQVHVWTTGINVVIRYGPIIIGKNHSKTNWCMEGECHAKALYFNRIMKNKSIIARIMNDLVKREQYNILI